MHIPAHFRVTDRSIIERFIRTNSFATLVTSNESFPMATHIPIELEVNANGKTVLWGHMSRANAQWKTFASYPDVLAIFLSPVNRYISSSWYNFPEVPTWNYLSAQVSGRIKVTDDDTSWEMVRRLTEKYERDSENPVVMENLPPDVLKQMKGIVGFEIEIIHMEASFKLSQNRDDVNFENIISNLRATNDPQSIIMADVMELQRLKP